MKFPCTSCGACCRKIGKLAPKLKGTPFEFPHKWDESGACEMLGADNRCKVYDDRPLICNIQRFAEALSLDPAEFRAANIKACNQLMDDEGLPPELRIPTT
jgi:Fe-S-cluster containining protein